jgi:hypothetical protein
MAPAKPNAFWVKKWLKDHDIDALLADAVNKVCAAEQPGDGPHANCEQTALRSTSSHSRRPCITLSQEGGIVATLTLP